jgi:nitric oxide synthase oxygenase domain/subunit
MVGAKTTGTFTDSQFVLDEPGEVAWRDSKRPFSSQLWWHELSTLLSLTR